MELWSRRIMGSLWHHGGCNRTTRFHTDHIHRWFGPLRRGRLLRTYRRPDHWAPSSKVLELRAEKPLSIDLPGKESGYLITAGSPGEIRTPVSRLLQPLCLRGSRAD